MAPPSFDFLSDAGGDLSSHPSPPMEGGREGERERSQEAPSVRMSSPPESYGAGSKKDFPSLEAREKYLRRRMNNNASAQKSRMKRKQLEQEAIELAESLKAENKKLKEELSKLQTEAETLKEVVRQLISRGQ